MSRLANIPKRGTRFTYLTHMPMTGHADDGEDISIFLHPRPLPPPPPTTTVVAAEARPETPAAAAAADQPNPAER